MLLLAAIMRKSAEIVKAFTSKKLGEIKPTGSINKNLLQEFPHSTFFTISRPNGLDFLVQYQGESRDRKPPLIKIGFAIDEGGFVEFDSLREVITIQDGKMTRGLEISSGQKSSVSTRESKKLAQALLREIYPKIALSPTTLPLEDVAKNLEGIIFSSEPLSLNYLSSDGKYIFIFPSSEVPRRARQTMVKNGSGSLREIMHTGYEDLYPRYEVKFDENSGRYIVDTFTSIGSQFLQIIIGQNGLEVSYPRSNKKDAVQALMLLRRAVVEDFKKDKQRSIWNSLAHPTSVIAKITMRDSFARALPRLL